MAVHIFTREELETILNDCVGKTLGEIDSNNVFARAIGNDKITGIAGDVIEQSVLKYPADTKQAPDLTVDGVEIELKTTGLRTSKSMSTLEAKEPVSITAVSPDKIIKETFRDSNFWHKLENLLFVYYLYDSQTTVVAAEYAKFPIKGYQFHQFSPLDQAILERDWQVVKDFILELQQSLANPEERYPEISHLRAKLVYIDTAPKWPNNPRFRLKRSVVTSIAQEYLASEDYKQLSQSIESFDELDNLIHNVSDKYRNQTIREIANNLDIQVSENDKSVGEKMLLKMLGTDAKSISKIDFFAKAGIIAKTIKLTATGKRTEDIKFKAVDFEEIRDNDKFEDSELYSYFGSNSFLFSVFEEPNVKVDENGKKRALIDCTFKGFKRITLDDNFINATVEPMWQRLRSLVVDELLEEVMEYKFDGSPMMNKSGTQRSHVNLPKSSASTIFLRGTGADATKKNEVVNGIRMYVQSYWLKGSYIADVLKETEYV